MGGGEGGGKTPPGEDTCTGPPVAPPDGPDHSTRPKGHHSGRGQNSRLVTPNWCAPQVPMCRSWSYKAVNPPPEKQTN